MRFSNVSMAVFPAHAKRCLKQDGASHLNKKMPFGAPRHKEKLHQHLQVYLRDWCSFYCYARIAGYGIFYWNISPRPASFSCSMRIKRKTAETSKKICICQWRALRKLAWVKSCLLVLGHVEPNQNSYVLSRTAWIAPPYTDEKSFHEYRFLHTPEGERCC